MPNLVDALVIKIAFDTSDVKRGESELNLVINNFISSTRQAGSGLDSVNNKTVGLLNNLKSYAKTAAEVVGGISAAVSATAKSIADTGRHYIELDNAARYMPGMDRRELQAEINQLRSGGASAQEAMAAATAPQSFLRQMAGWKEGTEKPSLQAGQFMQRFNINQNDDAATINRKFREHVLTWNDQGLDPNRIAVRADLGQMGPAVDPLLRWAGAHPEFKGRAREAAAAYEAETAAEKDKEVPLSTSKGFEDISKSWNTFQVEFTNGNEKLKAEVSSSTKALLDSLTAITEDAPKTAAALGLVNDGLKALAAILGLGTILGVTKLLPKAGGGGNTEPAEPSTPRTTNTPRTPVETPEPPGWHEPVLEGPEPPPPSAPRIPQAELFPPATPGVSPGLAPRPPSAAPEVPVSPFDIPTSPGGAAIPPVAAEAPSLWSRLLNLFKGGKGLTGTAFSMHFDDKGRMDNFGGVDLTPMLREQDRRAAEHAQAATPTVPAIPAAPGQDQPGILGWLRRSIPHFATGGVVTGPTTALIGEAGPEAVIPLSDLPEVTKATQAAAPSIVEEKDTMAEAVHEGVSRALQDRTGASLASPTPAAPASTTSAPAAPVQASTGITTTTAATVATTPSAPTSLGEHGGEDDRAAGRHQKAITSSPSDPGWKGDHAEDIVSPDVKLGPDSVPWNTPSIHTQIHHTPLQTQTHHTAPSTGGPLPNVVTPTPGGGSATKPITVIPPRPGQTPATLTPPPPPSATTPLGAPTAPALPAPGAGNELTAPTLPQLARGTAGAKGTSFTQKGGWVTNQLMKDFGLTDAQAAGLTGNLGFESGGLNFVQEGRPLGGRGGIGWAQWTGPRRRAFEKFAADHKGMNANEVQYAFLKHELETTHKSTIAALKNTSTVEQATATAMKVFEAPKDQSAAQTANRIPYARQALALATQPQAPGTPAQAAATRSAGPRATGWTGEDDANAIRNAVGFQPTQPPANQNHMMGWNGQDMMDQYRAASMQMLRVPVPPPVQAPNTNTTTSTTHVGQVNVHTPATDVRSIVADIHRELSDHLILSANDGMAGIGTAV